MILSCVTKKRPKGSNTGNVGNAKVGYLLDRLKKKEVK